MPSAFVLLRCIGKAAVKNIVNLAGKAAVKHIVNLASFGIGGDILVDAWDYWQKATRDEQRPAEVQAVAQMSAAELRAEIARIVQEEAAALPAAQQAQVASYLGQVPAMVRRSLRRPSDPTGTTIASGTVFRKPEDLLPLLPAALPRFKAGDRPAGIGDWELVELLGVGGFGEVWKARNPHFDGMAPVALKFCLDAAARDRLLKHEAAVLNQVMRQGKHEGIVPLLHTYLSADPPCLAYEYIDGGDLAGLIQERRDGLSAQQAARIIQRLAEIVAFAHRLSPAIVHRDLKPANILVKSRPDGKLALRITDFGIGGLAVQEAMAKSRRGTSSGEFLTAAVRGTYTPLYASPQQMRGDKPDPGDDVYSLGVIWYQLLTGDLTKGRPGGEAWRKRLTDRGMTPTLLALLASSYEDERADRPATALVLAEKLGRLLRQWPEEQEEETRRQSEAERQRQEQIRQAEAERQRREEETRRQANAERQRREREEDERRQRQEQVRQAEMERQQREEETRRQAEAERQRQEEEARRRAEEEQQRREQELAPLPLKKEQSRQPAPGDIIANSIGMKFAWIPPGTFQMGSPPGEEKRSYDETQHKVTMTKGFYLGFHEVTQAQWRTVMGNDPSRFKGDNLPVESVSWDDCHEFCQKLSQMDDKHYRLPTEAEWEYACRANTKTAYFFGDDPNQLGDYAWYNANSGGKTHKVGIKKPNPWELFDMHGNVREWCDDSNGSYLGGYLRDRQIANNRAARAVRGGSWNNGVEGCRAAYRDWHEPGSHSSLIGLRVCFYLD